VKVSLASNEVQQQQQQQLGEHIDNSVLNTKDLEKIEPDVNTYVQEANRDLEEENHVSHQRNSGLLNVNGDKVIELNDEEESIAGDEQRSSISNVADNIEGSNGALKQLDQRQAQPSSCSGVSSDKDESSKRESSMLENKLQTDNGTSENTTSEHGSDNGCREKQISSNTVETENDVQIDMSKDKRDEKSGSVAKEKEEEKNIGLDSSAEQSRNDSNEGKLIYNVESDEKCKKGDEANQITTHGNSECNEAAVQSKSVDGKSESDDMVEKMIPDATDAKNVERIETADSINRVSNGINGDGNGQPDVEEESRKAEPLHDKCESSSPTGRVPIESNDRSKEESVDLVPQASNDAKNDESKSVSHVGIDDKKYESARGIEQLKDDANDDKDKPSQVKKLVEPSSVKRKDEDNDSGGSKGNDKNPEKEKQPRSTQEKMSGDAKARMIRVSVTIPSNKNPGESFLFKNPAVPGQLLKVAVPSTGKAGGVLFVNVPAGRVDLPSSASSTTKPPKNARETQEKQSNGKIADKVNNAPGESSKKSVEPPKEATGKMLKVSVNIPDDKKPGDSFFFKNPAIAGQLLKVVVPSNSKPGGLLFVNVPTSVPASASNPSKPAAKKNPLTKRPAAPQSGSKQSESAKKKKIDKCKVAVKVPTDKKPGQSFTFENPSVPGQLLKVVIPPNAKPGGNIFVNVPALSTKQPSKSCTNKLPGKRAAVKAKKSTTQQPAKSRLAPQASKSQQQFLVQAPMHQLFMPAATAPYTATLNNVTRQAYTRNTTGKEQRKQPVKKAATATKPALSKSVVIAKPLLLSGKTEDCLCGRQKQCVSVMNRFYALGKHERVGYFSVPTLSEAQSEKSGRKMKMRACVMKHIFGARDRIEKNEGKKRSLVAKWHYQPAILKLCTKVAGDTVLPKSIPAELAKELKIHKNCKFEGDSDEYCPTPKYVYNDAVHELKQFENISNGGLAATSAQERVDEKRWRELARKNPDVFGTRYWMLNKERDGLTLKFDAERAALKKEIKLLRDQLNAKPRVNVNSNVLGDYSDLLFMNTYEDHMMNSAGISRMAILSDSWHNENPEAANHFFGFKTWALLKKTIFEKFKLRPPELRFRMGLELRLSPISDFERCLMDRMRSHRGLHSETIGYIWGRKVYNTAEPSKFTL